jgi:glycerol-3-phosphate cytidylyltransferase
VTIWKLREIVEARPWGEKDLVTTNGCFDLLHVGHLRVIEYAKSLGGWLLVLVNSDASIQALKGEGRPFVPEADRSRLVAALRAVDGAMIFRGRTPCDILGQLRPAFHVKGGDWRKQDLPETRIVERYGGRVVILPRDEGSSTSEIAERVRR